MRMTAKELAKAQNIPLVTVKKYCTDGIFRYHKIGRKYSIDVEYAIKALAKLDEQQHVIDTPIKPVTQCRHKVIRTEDDFRAAVRALKKEA